MNKNLILRTKKSFNKRGTDRNGKMCHFYDFPSEALFIDRSELTDQEALQKRCYEITGKNRKAQKLWISVIRFFHDNPNYKSVVIVDKKALY